MRRAGDERESKRRRGVMRRKASENHEWRKQQSKEGESREASFRLERGMQRMRKGAMSERTSGLERERERVMSEGSRQLEGGCHELKGSR